MTNFIEKHFVTIMFVMAIIPCVIQLLPAPEPSVSLSGEQEQIIRAYAAEAYKQIMHTLE
jgi:hypothetical protein